MSWCAFALDETSCESVIISWRLLSGPNWAACMPPACTTLAADAHPILQHAIPYRVPGTHLQRAAPISMPLHVWLSGRQLSFRLAPF